MKLFGLGWIAGLSVATFIVGWFMGRRARRLELERARRKAMLDEHDARMARAMDSAFGALEAAARRHEKKHEERPS